MFENLDPASVAIVFLPFYGVVALMCCIETLLESGHAGDRSSKRWALAIIIGLLWPLPIVYVGLGYCLAFLIRRRALIGLD